MSKKVNREKLLAEFHTAQVTWANLLGKQGVNEDYVNGYIDALRDFEADLERGLY